RPKSTLKASRTTCARCGAAGPETMAFGRLEKPLGSQPMSDINMTPLIDVMLVLLAIFMLTAPLMTSSLKLQLPQAEAPQTRAEPRTFSVALSALGQAFVDEQAVSGSELLRQAQAAARQFPGTEVHLRADQSVPYGRVAE